MSLTKASHKAIAASPSVTQSRRRRVAALALEGYSEREIAAKLGVSRTTVWNDKQALAGAAR